MNFLANIASSVGSYISSFVSNEAPEPEPFDASAITRDQVQEARAVLTNRLPLELVDIVLDYAEYWIRQNYIRREHVQVQAQFTHDPPQGAVLYLTTGALGRGEYFEELALVKPRRVVLRIEAHDQGWCDDTGIHGTFSGSFTWFEARIYRDEGGTAPLEEILPNGISNTETIRGPWGGHAMTNVTRAATPMDHRIDPDDYNEALESQGWQTVKNGESSEWLVARNRVARRQSGPMTVTWDPDNEGEEIAWPLDGCGVGGGFVRSLQRGDRIGIWARSKYGGWMNNVVSVEVDVYHSI
ncbi:hypothetical protein BT63DRAFT_235582 [Microthyrium microscopicum]|uniref:Uncharacterized protein n=1 Tax=Microthyrium microscopicum TaxID=703497 RepID=A0A6A6UDV5_9PEZI|nr:hypothetical protein BT63DRAFT_235582 [Microthyrium microscopicum]